MSELGDLSERIWAYAAMEKGQCPNFTEVPAECDCIACRAITALATFEDCIAEVLREGSSLKLSNDGGKR